MYTRNFYLNISKGTFVPPTKANCTHCLVLPSMTCVADPKQYSP